MIISWPIYLKILFKFHKFTIGLDHFEGYHSMRHEMDGKEATAAKIVVYSNGDEEYLHLYRKSTPYNIISYILLCLKLVLPIDLKDKFRKNGSVSFQYINSIAIESSKFFISSLFTNFSSSMSLSKKLLSLIATN
jgi:hypothetical protein